MDKAHAVCQRQGPGGDKGRVFAEAVPRHAGRFHRGPQFLFKRPEHSDADGEDGRLGYFRMGQLLRGAVEYYVAQ
ncbi:hypothetical protein SDC9_156149 [bioreactor metagenome]|uniref:Uncharacterized protein n=1 Tax=bioreactor metagenome TaxID=1076179 RepID=A0A645F8R6_9ZZZZ